MSESNSRQSKSVRQNLQKMRYPKPRVSPSPSPPPSPRPTARPQNHRETSSYLNRSKSQRDITEIYKKQKQEEFQKKTLVKKIIDEVLNLDYNSIAVPRKKVLEILQPHVLLNRTRLIARDQIGRRVLANGFVIRTCCQIFRTNPYFDLADMIIYIRKDHLDDVTEHKAELESYLTRKYNACMNLHKSWDETSNGSKKSIKKATNKTGLNKQAMISSRAPEKTPDKAVQSTPDNKMRARKNQIRRQITKDMLETLGYKSPQKQESSEQEAVITRYDEQGNQIKTGSQKKQNKLQVITKPIVIEIVSSSDEENDKQKEQNPQKNKIQFPKQEVVVTPVLKRVVLQNTVPFQQSQRVKSYSPYRQIKQQPDQQQQVIQKITLPVLLNTQTHRIKLPLKVEPSPRRTILRSPISNSKSRQTTPQKTPSKQKQLYPNFDDLQSPTPRRVTFSEHIPNIQIPSNSENKRQKEINSKIYEKMESIFQSSKLFTLDEVHLIGIIEYNYHLEGKFAILLVVNKMDPYNRQLVGVMPISEPFDYDFLREIKKDTKVDCWIKNSNKVDIREYWRSKLREEEERERMWNSRK